MESSVHGACSQEAAQGLAPLQRSAYCSELLLLRDGTELSFEELRAQHFYRGRQLVLDEKLQQLQKARESLSLELEEKKKLLSQQKLGGFQVYDESQTEALTSRNQAPGVFLRPGDSGPAVSVQSADSGRLVVSAPDLVSLSFKPQVSPHVLHSSPSASEAAQPQVMQKPLTSQKVSKSRLNLSAIQEAADSSSLGVTVVEGPGAAGQEQTNPCDPALRRHLLERSEVTSCPDLHVEPGPAPTVEEHSHLLLGGSWFQVHSRLVQHQRFCVFGAATQQSSVIIKTDKSTCLWDLHMIQCLKTKSTSALLPDISCHQFEDGCITVYWARPGHTVSVLQECVTGEESLQKLVPSLLQLLTLLRSCGLVHGDLQPSVLACVSSELSSNWLFPLDWSSSVDLDIQRDVVSLQQLPAAHSYIDRGVLDAEASPHQLDQVGAAQSLHLLLTQSPMVPVKDTNGWTTHTFSDDTSHSFHACWAQLFHSLLSAGTCGVLESFCF